MIIKLLLIPARWKHRMRAHIFKKASNIGRVFRDGTLDKSLAANREAMMFLKRNLVSIMEMIDAFYGKR